MANRVWVVDDEPHIRTAMLAVLAELGYETRGFANAEELYTALVEEGLLPTSSSSTSASPTSTARRSSTRCASGPSTATSPSSS